MVKDQERAEETATLSGCFFNQGLKMEFVEG